MSSCCQKSLTAYPLWILLLLCALSMPCMGAGCVDHTTCSACVVSLNDTKTTLVETRCQWCNNSCWPGVPPWATETPLCTRSTTPDAMLCPECQNLAPMPNPGLRGWYVSSVAVATVLLGVSVTLAIRTVCCGMSHRTFRVVNYGVSAVADFYALACLTRNTVVVWQSYVPASGYFTWCTHSQNDLSAMYPGLKHPPVCNFVIPAPSGLWVLVIPLYAFVVLYSLVIQYHVDFRLLEFHGCRFRYTRTSTSRGRDAWKYHCLSMVLALAPLGAAPAVYFQQMVPLNDSCVQAQTLDLEITMLWIFGAVSVSIVPALPLVWSVAACTVRCLCLRERCCGNNDQEDACCCCLSCRCCINAREGLVIGVTVTIVVGLILNSIVLASFLKQLDWSFPVIQLVCLCAFPSCVQLAQGLLQLAVVALLTPSNSNYVVGIAAVFRAATEQISGRREPNDE